MAGVFLMSAMSSYALIQGLSGIRYDAVEKVLFVNPRIDGDFRCFLSTATGFGAQTSGWAASMAGAGPRRSRIWPAVKVVPSGLQPGGCSR